MFCGKFGKCSKGDGLIGCLVFLVIIAAAVVIGGGYLGLIPAVSKILGTNKARDLGVKYTQADAIKAHELSGTKTLAVKEMPTAVTAAGTGAGNNSENNQETSSETDLKSGLLFEGTKPAKYSVNSQELTAMANSGWKYGIFSDIQIKIGNDGVVETSAVLRVDKIISFAKSMGFSQDQIESAMKEYKIPAANIPVYAKGNFEVVNGNVDIRPQVIEISRVKLPQSIVEKATPQAVSAVDSVIKSFPGFSIKNLSFADGKMNFEGTVPAKQTILTE